MIFINNLLANSAEYWDSQAPEFDNDYDHGLLDANAARAWAELLAEYLPNNRQSFLDLGCGTGSLSKILIPHFNQGLGIDFSAKMIELARSKCGHHQNLGFAQADAFAYRPAATFDLIVCRHLLWLSTSAETSLQHWLSLLNDDGRLVLVEGFWETMAGIRHNDLIDILGRTPYKIKSKNLSPIDALWGKAVRDERYLVCIEL